MARKTVSRHEPAIFVDTGAFLALARSADQYHRQAVEYWNGLSPHPHRVTTSFIIDEAYTLMRRGGAGAAARFLDAVEAAQEARTLTVLWPEEGWWGDIRGMLARFHDQDLSYTDAVSLVACRRRHDIGSVFGFDHHLRLSGLPLVP